MPLVVPVLFLEQAVARPEKSRAAPAICKYVFFIGLRVWLKGCIDGKWFGEGFYGKWQRMLTGLAGENT